MGKGIKRREEDEKIRAFLKLTPAQRLHWLEDIHALTGKSLTPEQKKRLAKLTAQGI